MKRRPVFSDGGNSFSHVVFGMASAYIQVGILVFVAYQMHDFRNANFVVDMLEFAIGYALMCALRSLIAAGHSQRAPVLHSNVGLLREPSFLRKKGGRGNG